MKGMSSLGTNPIELHVTERDRQTTATASKGNQTKWCKDKTLWVKADFMGYEGLADCGLYC